MPGPESASCRPGERTLWAPVLVQRREKVNTQQVGRESKLCLAAPFFKKKKITFFSIILLTGDCIKWILNQLVSLICNMCLFYLFAFINWRRHAACGISVPQPGVEPVAPAVQAWSPDHWTAGEVPGCTFLFHSAL